MKIVDKDTAADAVREIGLCRIRIAKAEARMNEKISNARLEADNNTATDRARAEALENLLARWWQTARKDFPDKSWKLLYGVMGTRQNPAKVALLRGFRLPAVIAALGSGLGQYLRQRDPELDKAAVLAAPPADLELLATAGVTIKPGKEEFYVKPDLDFIEKGPRTAPGATRLEGRV